MTVILGVLNVTPDSFSDGGEHLAVADALAHARVLRAAGADLVDVGGESTRPGADRVPTELEQARVVPVIAALTAEGIATSVDTMNAATALAAVAAGASLINDVSGGLADPAMPEAMARAGVDVVAMHWRGHSSGMEDLARYGDVVADVRDELAGRVAALTSAGVARERIILDPGLGFAKTPEHNWALVRRLDEITALGLRVLVGASRKRFLRELAASVAAAPAEPAAAEPAAAEPAAADRWRLPDVATATTSVLAAQGGAWGVRVHDVAATRVALATAAAWQRGSNA